jgi:hypothetical protein
MYTLTWNCQCFFCHKPITRGRPTFIVSIDKPVLFGVSHSTCCATKYRYGHFQMCPPYFISNEQLSFIVYYFPKLYSLAGAWEPNWELRHCAAELLYSYPETMLNPLVCIQRFREQNKNKPWTYKGDLEADFLKFLGQVQKAAKEKPIEIEADFRKTNKPTSATRHPTVSL